MKLTKTKYLYLYKENSTFTQCHCHFPWKSHCKCHISSSALLNAELCSVGWTAENIPPHRQRCWCLICLFSSEPPYSLPLPLLSLISRTFRSVSILPARKVSVYVCFFIIQSVRKGGNTKIFKVDLNIQIHNVWRSLKVGKNS